MQDIRLPNDYQCDNQLSIFDYIEDPEVDTSLIAVSKVFASAIKQMNLAEWKTFVMALTHIKWNEQNKMFVRLDKKSLAQKLGINSDSDHLSQDLKRAIGSLAEHSKLEFDNQDGWSNGFFIGQVVCGKESYVRVQFNPVYMPLFEQLGQEKNYITMWADDLFQMSSERSILFYENLRLNSDTRKENSKVYGIKDLKTMFGIPKDGKGSYMRKDGHFDRPSFEKRIIDPICEDLAKCSMINLTVDEEGKPYRKIKNNRGNVLGYEFQWVISNHPRVATAKEVRTLNQNPQELKIAKDIKKGEKKKSTQPKKSKNNFNNFPQNEYNFEELENLLVEN